MKPQKEKNTKKSFPKTPFTLEREIFILHYDTMIELYKAHDTDYMIVDKYGIYPRIYFLKCANLEEVRDWYDFGSITSIYYTTPSFPEIKRLPNWIKNRPHDTYKHNHMISYNDSFALDFISVAPNFDDDNESYQF